MAAGQTINGQAFIAETASMQASRIEVAGFYSEQDRKHDLLVKDCCQNALAGQTEGWLITLHTKTLFKGRIDSNKLFAECMKLERQTGIIAKRLNKYCYRHFRDQRLKLLGGIEIGKEYGRLHMHLVATHSGNVDKTPVQMREFVHKQWSKFYQFKQGGFIDVQPIDDVQGAVRYITGEAAWMQQQYGFGNVSPF